MDTSGSDTSGTITRGPNSSLAVPLSNPLPPSPSPAKKLTESGTRVRTRNVSSDGVHDKKDAVVSLHFSPTKKSVESDTSRVMTRNTRATKKVVAVSLEKSKVVPKSVHHREEAAVVPLVRTTKALERSKDSIYSPEKSISKFSPQKNSRLIPSK